MSYMTSEENYVQKYVAAISKAIIREYLNYFA